MTHKKDCSPVVAQRSKIKESLTIREFPWTEKQKQLIELVQKKETKIVYISGCAGTAKTLLSVYLGLVSVNSKKTSDIFYIRTVIESASKGLGFLPGESGEKFAPFLMPLEDKLEELISKSDIHTLKNDNRIQGIPINYLRGANLNAKFIISDESQNFDFKELTTLITRFGKFSKLLVLGDPNQSDINGKSGFQIMYNIFDNPESRQNGIFCFEFGIEDVMRSEEVKFILSKLEQFRKNNKT